MNAIDLLKVMVVAGCVAVTSTAWSQTNDSMASPAAAAPTAKATKQADRRLGRSVRTALSRGGVNVSNVFVRARSGVVTLTGTVPEGGQIAQAGDIAKGVQGVTSVNNRVTLGLQGGGGN
ncbi:BON domain-containing protein [Paraburkholderia humisilvae]|uniref:BON domain-containing protein n=1 Tax=Paraburkholderia humisilvae TaxID=627669 RepID=A0A6J5DYS2_9BURK|nr:BON domain-containing protein [Paraburkholderia humisilvae]CAB3758142.1 hypothetical protein LMG29542_03258 [Paraburkholderia humisilvae]